jgi:hypothetical protein
MDINTQGNEGKCVPEITVAVSFIAANLVGP